MLDPILIENVRPATPTGRYPAKAVAGERVRVTADIFKEGHDEIAAEVRWGRADADKKDWQSAALTPLGNDLWEAFIQPAKVGAHLFSIDAWTSQQARNDRTTGPTMKLWVDRPTAANAAWYEMFPRSEGGLEGAAKRLSAIADMGFDVVYLPPVHPIGFKHRKGRNNTLTAGPGDPGSPWAIGSAEGGHTSIHPELGTFEDFDRLVDEANRLGMEIALDYALQCSADHPWLTEHPEWFFKRPDGTLAYAENPPKKYQDIYPLNFWPEKEQDRKQMWEACREIVEFWLSRGIKIFRVDNPHTKPFAFWEWLIPLIQAKEPETIFLAEAFTRPKIMSKLAEIGFTQSYTYFTWRTSKAELTEYLQELAWGPKADYMRPIFWPNTPDILSGPLRKGPPAAFKQRLALAATMSPLYGMYSGYELCENEPASDTDEEYLYSEKYEIKRRDYNAEGNLVSFVTRLNNIRKSHPAFSQLRRVRFHETENAQVIAYSKASQDGSDVVMTIVSLDPFGPQQASVHLDMESWGLTPGRGSFTDELSGNEVHADNARMQITLDPAGDPCIFALTL